jgi:activator of HSP90 ATPase
MEDLKKYLKEQQIIVGKNDSERKLRLFEVMKIQGEASVAVVRGQPRMGYDLTLKLELRGVEKTFLEGLKCEVMLEELCDDGSGLGGKSVSMTTLLDTEQGA